jgi:hypothetical protein
MLAVALLATGASYGATLVTCVSLGTTITIQSIIDAGGCSVGDKNFNGFAVSGNLSASQITVHQIVDDQPIATGFQFQFNLTGASDFALTYHVFTASGLPLITSAHLSILGSNVTGDGEVSVGESVCADQGCTSVLGDLNAQQFSSTDPRNVSNQLSDDISFGGISSIWLSKDVNTDPGANGSATLSLISQTVDQVGTPEPVTFALIGSSLLGLGILLRRRKT